MKRVTAFFLSIIMLFSLCACGSKEVKPNKENLAREAVDHWTIGHYLYFEEGIQRAGLLEGSTVKNLGNGNYEVKGYVFICDDYGDDYKAKVDAIVSVDEAEAHVKEIDIGTFYK